MNEGEDLKPLPQPDKSASLIQRIGIYAVVLLVVFLLGFVPMWIKTRSSRMDLAAAEQKLTIAQLQNTIASAVIDARRGEYEPARVAASQFFTSLLSEVNKGEDSALNAAQRSAVQPLFAQRDEIITLLARSDPAAADRLSDLFATYRKAMGA
ncbi:MAG TPA: hypothetical protein VNO50_08155 [Pyrinomonadaceae bacterium]|nr:hypothetical protein [Pyrinomonadaceae bacterium]